MAAYFCLVGDIFSWWQSSAANTLRYHHWIFSISWPLFSFSSLVFQDICFGACFLLSLSSEVQILPSNSCWFLRFFHKISPLHFHTPQHIAAFFTIQSQAHIVFTHTTRQLNYSARNLRSRKFTQIWPKWTILETFFPNWILKRCMNSSKVLHSYQSE